MSTTPPDDPYGTEGGTQGGTPGGTPGEPPSGPDYGAPPPGPDYGQPGGYGTPPPPPGGYGTPPPGGYGTPPGGYGTPPPGGPYGTAPGGYQQPADDWSIGDALGYGWTKFTQNVGQILLAALLLLIASAIGFGISVPIRNAVDNGDGSFFVLELANALAQIIVTFLTWIVQAAIVRGALDITEGRRFEIGGLFSRINIGNVVIAALLVSIITFVGTLLCILPGIVAWFMLLFTPFFVVDRDLPAVEAIKASFNFTRANLGNMLVWVIVGGIVYVIGYCLCGVGIIVTAPVVLIGAAYTYKKLSGQPVAP